MPKRKREKETEDNEFEPKTKKTKIYNIKGKEIDPYNGRKKKIYNITPITAYKNHLLKKLNDKQIIKLTDKDIKIFFKNLDIELDKDNIHKNTHTPIEAVFRTEENIGSGDFRWHILPKHKVKKVTTETIDSKNKIRNTTLYKALTNNLITKQKLIFEDNMEKISKEYDIGKNEIDLPIKAKFHAIILEGTFNITQKLKNFKITPPVTKPKPIITKPQEKLKKKKRRKKQRRIRKIKPTTINNAQNQMPLINTNIRFNQQERNYSNQNSLHFNFFSSPQSQNQTQLLQQRNQTQRSMQQLIQNQLQQLNQEQQQEQQQTMVQQLNEQQTQQNILPFLPSPLTPPSP